ncbi:MAG: hypothetical protein IJD60_03475 [Clostridia bacterium]|nr:hypothetical protein [Clostridia bacterium]
MEWLQAVGFCLLAAAMVMVLRQMHVQTAGLLAAASGVLLLGVVLPEIRAYVEQIGGFLASLDLDGSYYRVMLKAMGIVLVTHLASEICEDMDASSIAKYVGLCGRIALLSIAVPVFMELTQMAVDVLK